LNLREPDPEFPIDVKHEPIGCYREKFAWIIYCILDLYKLRLWRSGNKPSRDKPGKEFLKTALECANELVERSARLVSEKTAQDVRDFYEHEGKKQGVETLIRKHMELRKLLKRANS
jgi:hypothetical protein